MISASVFHFHNCYLKLEDYRASDFFEYWRWQLDPWRCKTIPDDATVLTLKYDAGNRPLTAWTKIGELGKGLFRCVISQDPEGNTLWEYVWPAKEDVFSTYWMSADCTDIRLVWDDSRTMGNQPFVFLNFLMPSVMLMQNAITFHGVLMEHDGRGIILSAPSETGKTTHARMWRDLKRAIIINGDRAVCTKENGQWIGFGLPWSGSSGEQMNRDVPVKAFVVLEQADENRVERLTGFDAFGAVYPNLLHLNWNKELTEKALNYIDEMLLDVPVFRLYCRPDAGAVDVLDRALRDL